MQNNMEKTTKREVFPILKNILALDIALTRNFVSYVEKFKPLKQLKVHYKVLEISCHGIPWIACTLAFIWIMNNKNLYQMQVNLLFGLILDIIIIALSKAIIRRRRPAPTDDPFAVGPDKYSFPSGHASRAMFIFYFFNYLWPISAIFFLPSVAWVFSVVVSRILMRRHHILDICAGLFTGYIEGILMSILYLDSATCSNFIFWLTSESLDGAD